MIFVCMGVSGSGKTTIGKLLAERAYMMFADANDYGPGADPLEVTSGELRSDEDSKLSLGALNKLLRDWQEGGKGGVLACPALKQTHRDILTSDLHPDSVLFILLDGPRELIQARLSQRPGSSTEYASLEPQLAMLEIPTDAIRVSNEGTPDSVVEEVVHQIQNRVPGRITTFYSYKGGTGRSMAMANVAWLAALAGARVLVLDWDLEAPGLHRYFRPFLDDAELVDSDGLIDFAVHFVEAASEQGEKPEPNWYKSFSNILPYAKSINYPFANGGALDFIPAGRQTEDYALRVNSFNWKHFYEKLGGNRVLEEMCDILRGEYQFVFIDSRTGVSDTAGICTVEIPDDMVVCFTLNLQSVLGASAVAGSVLNQRKERNLPIHIFPLPTRVENVEKVKTDIMKAFAKPFFLPVMPDSVSQEDREKYWSESDVPYVPFYAFEENLAYFRDELNSTRSVLPSMVLLAQRLTWRRLGGLPKVPSQLQAEVVGIYDSFSLGKEPRTLTITSNPQIYVSADNGSDNGELQATLSRSGFELLTRERFEGSHSATLLIAISSNALTASQTADIALATRLRKGPVYTVLLPGALPEALPRLLLPFGVIDLREGQPFHLPVPEQTEALHRLPVAPYLGLNPFTVNDELVFFARGSVVEQVLEAIKRSKLVALIGPPGSGKTSIIQAGVIPRLNLLPPDQRWDIRLSWPSGTKASGPTLLVIDGGPLPTRDAVIPEHACVLAVAEAPEQIAAMERSLRVTSERIDVPAFTESELIQVISQPALRAGLSVEPVFAQRLARDVVHEKSQLSLLQFVMSQMYSADPQGEFTLEKYERLGGTATIELRCDAIANAGDFDWLSRLIYLKTDGTIALQTIPETNIPTQNQGTVNAFVSAGILAREQTFLRFSSRIFVDRWLSFQNWIKDNRDSVLWRQQLIESANAWNVNPLAFRLLNGSALAEATQRVNTHRERFNARELSYIQASEKNSAEISTTDKNSARSPLRNYVSLGVGLLTLTFAAFLYLRPSVKHQQIISVFWPPVLDGSMSEVSQALTKTDFKVLSGNTRTLPPPGQMWYSPDVPPDRVLTFLKALNGPDSVPPEASAHSEIGQSVILLGPLLSPRKLVAQWGISLSSDETLYASGAGASSAVWEIHLADKAGFQNVAIYHRDNLYVSVLRAEQQDLDAMLRTIRKQSIKTPYWGKAESVELGEWCPDAVLQGTLPTGTLHAPVYDCAGTRLPTSPVSVDYPANNPFRGQLDEGTHVFTPTSPFVWDESLNRININKYQLLTPSSVASCTGLILVKLPVISRTRIFVPDNLACTGGAVLYSVNGGAWNDVRGGSRVTAHPGAQ